MNIPELVGQALDVISKKLYIIRLVDNPNISEQLIQEAINKSETINISLSEALDEIIYTLKEQQ